MVVFTSLWLLFLEPIWGHQWKTNIKESFMIVELPWILFDKITGLSVIDESSVMYLSKLFCLGH